MNSETAATHFADSDEFTDVLAEAVAAATTDWEVEFTQNIESRYEKYGMDMYLSKAQVSQLQRIVQGQ